MEKNIRISNIFLLILIFNLSLPLAKAFDLGVLQKSSFGEMPIGGTHEFTILLWNTRNSSYLVQLTPKLTENLIVTLIPNKLVLNKSKTGPPYETGEYVALPLGDVKAFPVKVLVKAPLNTEFGKHEILIEITGGNASSGVSFIQKKTLRFVVNVTKSLSPTGGKIIHENVKKFLEILENTGKKISEKVSLLQIDLKLLFLILSIITIIGISVFVYKFT